MAYQMDTKFEKSFQYQSYHKCFTTSWEGLLPVSWKVMFKTEFHIFMKLHDQTDTRIQKLEVNDKLEEVANTQEDGIQIQN